MLSKMVPFLTALLPLIPLAVAAWIKLAEVLRPLLARRTLRVVILDALGTEGAKTLLATLRKTGYKEATITRSTQHCGGARVVVLWQPDGTQADTILREVQDASPEAHVLILTYGQLQVTRSERVLLSNSPLRLRSDLNTVAEVG